MKRFLYYNQDSVNSFLAPLYDTINQIMINMFKEQKKIYVLPSGYSTFTTEGLLRSNSASRFL